MQVGPQRLADLTVLEFANTLNEALCERHRVRCADAAGAVPAAVVAECRKTYALAEEIRVAYLELGEASQGPEAALCRDGDERCPDWTRSGDCDSNAGAPPNALPVDRTVA